MCSRPGLACLLVSSHPALLLGVARRVGTSHLSLVALVIDPPRFNLASVLDTVGQDSPISLTVLLPLWCHYTPSLEGLCFNANGRDLGFSSAVSFLLCHSNCLRGCVSLLFVCWTWPPKLNIYINALQMDASWWPQTWQPSILDHT